MNFTLGMWGDDWQGNYNSYWDGIEEQAEKLDYLYPDWYKEVDLDRLDMGDGENCIVAQLWGNDGETSYYDVTFYFGLNDIYFAGGDLWWYTQILNRRMADV